MNNTRWVRIIPLQAGITLLWIKLFNISSLTSLLSDICQIEMTTNILCIKLHALKCGWSWFKMYEAHDSLLAKCIQKLLEWKVYIEKGYSEKIDVYLWKRWNCGKTVTKNEECVVYFANKYIILYVTKICYSKIIENLYM